VISSNRPPCKRFTILQVAGSLSDFDRSACKPASSKRAMDVRNGAIDMIGGLLTCHPSLPRVYKSAFLVQCGSALPGHCPTTGQAAAGGVLSVRSCEAPATAPVHC